MTTNNLTVLGQHSACAVRVTRLDATCTPVPGATGGAVLLGFVTGTNTPEVETGTKFEPKDGCGRVSFVDEDPDVVKRRNLTLEFNFWDYEGIELMTDSSLILGKTATPSAGKVVGINTAGIGTTTGDPIGLEIWTKNAKGTAACGGASFPPYTRHLFPRAKLTLGDFTYDNAAHTLKLTGWSTANANWGDPWEDWPGATNAAATSPWTPIEDYAIPAVGDSVTGGGYVTLSAPS